ncbi:MAG: hypothetical protein H5U40_03475, partial [Polyangiaceae bacterium]|nr:hypothetical protein [Polyangiaceae bacterium]
MPELVFPFDAELPDESARRFLGGKGAGLAAMTRIGIPVPPGFTLTTDVYRRVVDGNGELGGLTPKANGGDVVVDEDDLADGS